MSRHPPDNQSDVINAILAIACHMFVLRWLKVYLRFPSAASQGSGDMQVHVRQRYA